MTSDGYERSPIGIAVIGSGRMGTHRARLAALHPAVEFLGVTDVDEERARALAEMTSAQHAGTDAAALITDPRVTSVIVSTAEHAHDEPIRLALEAGKPVLVEKPLSLTLEGARSVVELAESTGTELRVAYSMRYVQRYFVGWEQVRLGKVGRVVGGMTRVFSNRGTAFEILKRSPTATPVKDVVTYLVDVIGWYLGPEVRPVEVVARGHGVMFREHGHDVDDITLCIVTYDDGTVFSFDVSYVVPDRYPTTGQNLRVEVFGTDGVLLIDDDHRDQILYTEHGYTNAYLEEQKLYLTFLGSRSSGEWADGKMFGRVADETKAWFDHLATGVPCHHSTARDGLTTLAVTLAMEEAARTGAVVPVPDMSARS